MILNAEELQLITLPIATLFSIPLGIIMSGSINQYPKAVSAYGFGECEPAPSRCGPTYL